MEFISAEPATRADEPSPKRVKTTAVFTAASPVKDEAPPVTTAVFTSPVKTAAASPVKDIFFPYTLRQLWRGRLYCR